MLAERVRPNLSRRDDAMEGFRCGVRNRCIPMLPVMQVGRVRPGAPPEHDVLHPVGGGLGQARPTNNIGMHGCETHGASRDCR